MTYSPQRRAEEEETVYAEHAAAPTDRRCREALLALAEQMRADIARFPTSSQHGLHAGDHGDVEVNP